MSISDSPRFINTPTLLEEYNDDQKGYDQVIDGDTVIELHREYTAVQGNEEFYKVLLTNLVSPAPLDVVGNEGFMDTLKKGATSVIQAVKDFFKWLFSFFTGKKEIANRKVIELELKLEKNGVIEDEINYPASYTNVYDKTGITANNLAWMPGALEDVAKAMARMGHYCQAVEKGVGNIETAALLAGSKVDPSMLKVLVEEFVEGTRKALEIKEINKPVTFFGLCDIQMDAQGKLKELPDPPNTTKNPKFRTDLTQVRSLLGKQKLLTTNADTMLNNSVKLEKVFITALNKTLEKAKGADETEGKAFTKTAEEVQELVRHVMANVKLLEMAVFRAIFASSDILSATVKKG